MEYKSYRTYEINQIIANQVMYGLWLTEDGKVTNIDPITQKKFKKWREEFGTNNFKRDWRRFRKILIKEEF
jgi:hypothetical protein